MDMSLALDRRPLYAQTHDRLLALIQEGELGPGSRLPSETSLARQLGISRATLREALRLLEEDGVIVRRQGVGTFVTANQHLESGLERLESVMALAARQQLTAHLQNLTVESVAADESLAERLQVTPGSPVTRVCRTIIVAERPAAYMEDLIPSQWLPPDELDNSFTGSVLDLLRRRLNPPVQEAMSDITAVCAGSLLAKRLGIRRGLALILLEETLFNSDGLPVGFSRNYFVPGRFRFHVIRR